MLRFLYRRLRSRWPLLVFSASWTLLLTLTVAAASFAPELAFASAISPSSSFAAECKSDGLVRVPMDIPGDVLCVPDRLFRKSGIDLIVPPIFAAVVVAGSACFVRALGLWADDDDDAL
ncbi:uncharacterized protein LOC101207834 [Cucumis sativus]|uniref:Uncharacterized protein n=1 Tax=Cucumis sativus TaxID=3659 RepID=A0A0A0L0V5_CUCSA|nr:uncharacterized protein LOC101207834 [Cucumis sativus]KGN54232.1 hypothetical protein Csa_018146 [Cucumis sativus]